MSGASLPPFDSMLQVSAALTWPRLSGPQWLALVSSVAALGLLIVGALLRDAFDRVLRLRRQASDDHQRALFLAEAGELFSSSLELDQILQTVCKKSTQVLGDACAIHLREGDLPALHAVCAYEKPREKPRDLCAVLKEHAIELGRGHIGRVAQTGEPTLVQDYRSDPEVDRWTADVLGVRSLLAVPLMVNGYQIGVLSVASYSDRKLTDRDLRLAGLLADRAAIAIEHARLYRRMEALVEERTRELRETHRQLLEAERSNAIQALGAMVAHEIRNPLNVVRTTAYSLRQRLGRNDARVNRSLEVMDRNIEAAARIIQDLMDYGVLPPPDLALVDLGRLAHNIGSGIAFPPEVELRMEIAPELPRVRCDPGQIERALKNLLLNAIQAHDAPGRVILRVYGKQGRVWIEVEDCGRGVPVHDRARLFSPLFSTKIKGAGLGLPLTRRIFEENGGGISFSAREQGAVFEAWLPAADHLPDASETHEDLEEGEGVSAAGHQA